MKKLNLKLFVLLGTIVIVFFIVINIKNNNRQDRQQETFENVVRASALVKRPKVAITFDDGPSENTFKVLEVLKKYNAKATFFLVGENI